MNTIDTQVVEKRRHLRLDQGFDGVINTSYLGWRKIVCKNISEGGVYFEIIFNKLDKPKESFLCLRNEKIYLNIDFKNNYNKIEAMGIAKWSKEIKRDVDSTEREYGFGIQFTDIPPQQIKSIASYVLDQQLKTRKERSIEAHSLDLRIYPRVSATFPVNIIIKSDRTLIDSTPFISGYTLNISKTGAAITSNKVLHPGESIILIIKSFYDFNDMELLCEVVWCDPHSIEGSYQCGIKFTWITSVSVNILEQIIEFKKILIPRNPSKSKLISTSVISEPISYKNRFGDKIIAMYDHLADTSFNQPFIIIPPAHGETKKNSIMLGYYLAKNNFNVIRYDNTNHLGESDGDIYFTTLDNVKEDMTATLNYARKQFGASEIGMVVPSLTSRVALRVAAENQCVKFLLTLVGVVNVQNTLKSVYQEDIIGMIINGDAKNRKTFNILGYESDKEYPISAVRNNLHTLESTIEDVSNINAPIVAISAEKDVWVDLNEVKKVFLKPSQFPRNLIIIPDALHHFYENMNVTKDILRSVVFFSLKYLNNKDIPLENIKEIDYYPVILQNLVEKERLKKYELSKEEERNFWGKYLNRYIIVDKSPDFKDYLSLITKYIPWAKSNIRILDAGCGPGLFGLWLLQKAIKGDISPYRYVGIDFVESALRAAKNNYSDLKKTLTTNTSSNDDNVEYSYILSDLDVNSQKAQCIDTGTCFSCFKDNTFDVVCCSLVISYLKDPLCALKELFRALKPGGNIIISSLKPYADLSLAFKRMVTSMNSSEEIEEARTLLNSVGLIRQKESEGHYIFYSENELSDIVSKAGGRNLKEFKTFTNQINIVIAKK